MCNHFFFADSIIETRTRKRFYNENIFGADSFLKLYRDKFFRANYNIGYFAQIRSWLILITFNYNRGVFYFIYIKILNISWKDYLPLSGPIFR